MKNTQTRVSAANTSNSCTTNPGSYLIVIPDPDEGGFFMHEEEWREFREAVISGDSDASKEMLQDAQERYEYVETMLPATPLTPENLEELFADLDDCKAFQEVPPIILETYAKNINDRRQKGEDLDVLDKDGRKNIKDIIKVKREKIKSSERPANRLQL